MARLMLALAATTLFVGYCGTSISAETPELFAPVRAAATTESVATPALTAPAAPKEIPTPFSPIFSSASPTQDTPNAIHDVTKETPAAVNASTQLPDATVAPDDAKPAPDDAKSAPDAAKTAPVASPQAAAVTPGLSDTEELKSLVDTLKKRIAAVEKPEGSAVTEVEKSVADQYGCDQPVTTQCGRLTISGLVQVWFQHIDNDYQGNIVNSSQNALTRSLDIGHEAGGRFDNDTFRVRRTELRFNLEVNEHINAFIMMDPAREANASFAPVPASPSHQTIFLSPSELDALSTFIPNKVIPFPNVRFLQSNRSDNELPQLLQDAFIEFHDIVPHHSFRIGQFKPPGGEEASRNSGELDFVDRAMVTSVNNIRDLGAMVRGSWFYSRPKDFSSGRLQYSFGVFDGANGTVLADPEVTEAGNRADDNDSKDFSWRVLFRPIWEEECWYGKMEMGYARTDGVHGSNGNGLASQVAPIINDLPGPLGPGYNNLNIRQTVINRQAAWGLWRPNSWASGLWVRGEWGVSRDRPTPNYDGAIDLLGVFQIDPRPLSKAGFYTACGYELGKGHVLDCLQEHSFLRETLANVEFAFRYEKYQNIAVPEIFAPQLATRASTLLFSTQAYTAGVNYYIKGSNARLQANYIWVIDPNQQSLGLRPVNNNMFLMSFQVGF